MGKQFYHGTRELVYSNHEDIIDALTVSGRADVYEWRESGDDPSLPNSLYWRQRLDDYTTALTVGLPFLSPHRASKCQNHVTGAIGCAQLLPLQATEHHGRTHGPL